MRLCGKFRCFGVSHFVIFVAGELSKCLTGDGNEFYYASLPWLSRPNYLMIACTTLQYQRIFIRRRQSFVLSFLRTKQKRTALFCICDIVSSPDATFSSIISSVDACAAALSLAEFSDLVQMCDVHIICSLVEDVGCQKIQPNCIIRRAFG